MIRVGVRDAVRMGTWQEAVRSSAALLVELGAADTGYPDACVATVEEHGPYIVLARGLALVHARPEQGGLDGGVALTRLAVPVAFGHPGNDPVDLLLAFCTPDPDSHVAALSALAGALSAGLAARLRAAPDDHALFSLMKEALPDA